MFGSAAWATIFRELGMLSPKTVALQQACDFKRASGVAGGLAAVAMSDRTYTL